MVRSVCHPPFAKSREGWGTHCVVWRRKAGPPAHFSNSAREMAHPQLFSVDVKKTNPRYTSPLKWLTRLEAHNANPKCSRK
jgi:hypothetical protein